LPFFTLTGMDRTAEPPGARAPTALQPNARALFVSSFGQTLPAPMATLPVLATVTLIFSTLPALTAFFGLTDVTFAAAFGT